MDLEVVAVQTATGTSCGRMIDTAALNQIDVEVAVVVVIEQGGARAADLWLIKPAARPVDLHELDPARCGLVHEPLRFGTGRGCRRVLERLRRSLPIAIASTSNEDGGQRDH